MAIYRGVGGAGNATDDATIAQVSQLASQAANSASNAATSAANAASSASGASVSATQAAASASNAATSASTVASSIGTAISAANSATSSASAAATSANNAFISESNAANSASSVATNAASAVAAANNAAASASSASSSATNAATSASNASNSASAAMGSETAAAASAASALNSASSASTSASNAAASAVSASTSASNASTAATDAASSAAAALVSENNAASSEANASSSESNAASSASSATASASAAAASATNAANSASAASTSASNAANSASSASTSATNAANSATAAATSATNAANSASAASTSATNAANSATSAATSAAQANAVSLSNEPIRHSVRPSLLLDFANVRSLDPRITFSRASEGRFYDGRTVAKAEENLLIRSQEFENAAWVNVNSTDTANTETAPDGTTTADTLTDNATAGSHSVYQTVSVSANTTYVVSCFLKAGTSNYAILAFTDAGTSQRYFAADFKLDDGTVRTSAAGTSGTLTSATVTPVGSGWYRCVIIGQTNAVSATNRIYVGVSDGTSALGSFGIGSYTGTGSTVFAWGAQLEQRSAVTAYTPTTTQPITNYIPVLQTAAAGVARFDHNPVTGESLGLLIEEQRTNLLVRSEEFENAAWTKSNLSVVENTIVSPAGTLTADKLVENTVSSTHIINPAAAPAVTAGTAYTFSVYAKAAERSFVQLRCGASSQFSAIYNLATGEATSIVGAVTTTAVAVGNGWWRVSISFAADTTPLSVRIGIATNGTTTNYTGDGYSGIFIWGAQLEVEAFPTSYIPTVASQVTRSADAASMTGANFSSWYRQDEGTLYAEGASTGYVLSSNFPVLCTADDGSNTNRITLYQGGSATGVALNVRASGVSTAITNSNVNLSAASTKIAGGFSGTTQSHSVNGGEVITGTTNGVPSGVNGFYIGNRSSVYLNALNGTIRKIAYYPRRLTNPELQGLTS